jgi:hypothetical protein
MTLLSDPSAPPFVIPPAASAWTNCVHIAAACVAYALLGGGIDAAFC